MTDNKQRIAVFMDENFERTSDFTDDIITTDDLQNLLSEVGMYEDAPVLNTILIDFGFDSKPIRGTVDRLWKLKSKG